MEDFGFSSEIITAASTTITASTTRSTTVSLIEHSPADLNRHYLYTLSSSVRRAPASQLDCLHYQYSAYLWYD